MNGLKLPIAGGELVPPVLLYELIRPPGGRRGVLNTLPSSSSPKRTIGRGFPGGSYSSPSTPRKTKVQAQLYVTPYSVLDNLGAR